MSTDTERAYGIKQSTVEASHHFDTTVAPAAQAPASSAGRGRIAFNLNRGLRFAAAVTLLACAAAGCSVQGGQSKLDKSGVASLLPAPTKPGESGIASAAQPQAVASAETGLGGGANPGTAPDQTAATETVDIAINGLTLTDAVGLAIARHPDISRAQAVVAQSESRVAIAKAAWYPTIEYGLNPKYSRTYEHESSLSLGVNQLVYDFGRSKSRISAASATLDQERYLLADTIESIAFSTASTFIDLAASQEMIVAAQAQVKSLRSTKDKIETRLKAGLSDASDLNQAEVAIQRAAAEALSVQTEFDVAAGKLAEVAGVRPSRVQGLVQTSSLVQSLGGGDPDAIEQTPAVLAAQASKAAAAANVKLAKADRYPSIGVSVGQGLSTVRDIYGDYDRDTWVGLSLSGDISLGGLNKHQIRAAEAEERAEGQVLENQKLVTRTALGSAETEAAGAVARLQSYQNVIDLSRALIDLYWQQYTLNKRPLTDVINGEREVYQAEIARISAIADGDRARIRANAAVGRFVAQLKERKNPSK